MRVCYFQWVSSSRQVFSFGGGALSPDPLTKVLPLDPAGVPPKTLVVGVRAPYSPCVLPHIFGPGNAPV